MTRLTPKIIFGVSGDDLVFRDADIQPKLPRLEVRLEPILHVAFKVGNIQSVLVELKDVSQNVPRISNSIFLHGQLLKAGLKSKEEACYLEVIAKRPVAKHLEERVMIRIFANIIEI
jgi:hypothetical protein